MPERMVEQAVAAMVNSDNALAQRVISDDMILDASQRELDDRAITLIGKRQPMAQDLRAVVGAIRMGGDLERIGDLAKNIAKRVVAVTDTRQTLSVYRGLQTMAELVLDAGQGRRRRLRHTFGRAGQYRARARRRDRCDSIPSLFRELLTYMMEDPRNITACTHLLFCAKNIERIGDHVDQHRRERLLCGDGHAACRQSGRRKINDTIVVDEPLAS